MKVILFASSLFISSLSFSQTTIKLEDAAKHVGDSVTVCGKVAGGIFLEQMENSPTFLTLGAAYPDQLLTVVEELKKQEHEEKVKRLMSIIGKAKFPDFPITKYDVYD